MKTNKILSSFLLVVAVILAMPNCLSAQQIKIEVFGAPSFSVSTVSVTDAGLDISGSIEEALSNTHLNILALDRNISNNFEYDVFVSAANLPSNTFLDVKWISTGTMPNGSGGGKGALKGGDNYITLSENPHLFFSGKGERVDIDLLFNLRGLTVAQPMENLGYNIIFSVVRTK
jgi:hypothetical protein